MAELLSKSNETQIKDRSATVEKAVRRSPAVNPDIKMQKPAAPVSEKPVHHQAPQTVRTEKPVPAMRVEKSAPMMRRENPSPIMKAAPAKSPCQPVLNVEEKAAAKPAENKSPLKKKRVEKKKTRKTAAEREEQFKTKVNSLVMKTINKLPRGTSIAAVIVLAVLGLGGMGTILAFSYPAEAVIVPDAYIGCVPENEEKIQIRMARNKLELAQKHKYDYCIMNDNVDRAVKEIISILNQRR